MEDIRQANNQQSSSDLSLGRHISKTSNNLSGGAPRVIPPFIGMVKQDRASKDGNRRKSHGATDDVVSTITSDGLTVIHKKFYIRNDVLIITPKRSDTVHVAPPRFIVVYEMALHAGFRFPLAPELLKIFQILLDDINLCKEVQESHEGFLTYPKLFVKVLLDDVNLCGGGQGNPPWIFDISEVVYQSIAQLC
ncbi:hypothetical protein IEQ34_017622 [Dendrobium chrysotoxum]|uniref:Uncharacterized protein n=1 Tax=Dendrobium chrysotoxum TaxID=161865 RepID=A0AAV7GC62_DENCH|nr:hypothetical protein IEQ34_017622 [Dendrobium chrysotoxum]